MASDPRYTGSGTVRVESELASTAFPPMPPWGLGSTILWSLLVAIVFVVAQTAVGLVFVLPKIQAGSLNEAEITKLENNGLLVALSTMASAPCAIGLSWLLSWARGWRPREYLALGRVSPRQLGIWLLGSALLLATIDAVTWLSGRDIVPPTLVETYASAGFLPLLLLVMVVVAPVSEEIFFRGFMFRGLEGPPSGPGGAVFITVVAFALAHVQHDWFGVATIAVSGTYLGIVRWRTGSTTLTIVLHAFQNLVATIEVAVAAQMA